VGRVVLEWRRFDSLRKARESFRKKPCIYLLTDRDENVLKVGQSGDLWRRYFGGTGYMVDAAMHGSGKIVFAAAAPADEAERRRIEASLIFRHKPPFCIQERSIPPRVNLEIEHRGEAPKTML